MPATTSEAEPEQAQAQPLPGVPQQHDRKRLAVALETGDAALSGADTPDIAVDAGLDVEPVAAFARGRDRRRTGDLERERPRRRARDRELAARA